MTDRGSRYTGQRIALLTQHGKERVIAPVLEPALGCRVERVAGYDTDLLVVRPEGAADPRIRKGFAAWAELETAFAWALNQSASGRVFVETDVRAHANPTRMDNIRLAAAYLVNKLSSLWPACGTPGFWTVERVAGLPCADCGAPTREARAEVHGCLKCEHRETRARADVEHADPGRCDTCNP